MSPIEKTLFSNVNNITVIHTFSILNFSLDKDLGS